MNSRPPPRPLLAAALCLALMVLPTTALSARPQGVAKARAAPESRSARTEGDTLPPAVAAILRSSGLPAKSFAFDVRPVDGAGAAPLVAFHAEQSFLLASTTKVVT
ncbi:MAG: hypothetical protein ABIQ33_10010, partial [Caldimonas sp.]